MPSFATLSKLEKRAVATSFWRSTIRNDFDRHAQLSWQRIPYVVTAIMSFRDPDGIPVTIVPGAR